MTVSWVGLIAGLIPACAGKTAAQLTLFVLSQAHPRVCGENGWRPVDSPLTTGSSPRVRGKRLERDWMG